MSFFLAVWPVTSRNTFNSKHELKLRNRLLSDETHECELGYYLSIVAQWITEGLALILDCVGWKTDYSIYSYQRGQKVEHGSHKNLVPLLQNHIVVDVVGDGNEDKRKVQNRKHRTLNRKYV